MRDYKNVRVPGSYRRGTKRTSIKRVSVERGIGRSAAGGLTGVKGAALQVLVFIIIVVVGWFGWQIYRTITQAEMFQIAGIDVKGVKAVGEADLREIADVFTGQNIFRVDLDRAVRRARMNPWVKDVRVYRSLPNRISMVITEHVPAAILDTGAERFLVDSEATVINKLSQEQGHAWPLPVVAIKDYRARSGDRVSTGGMNEALTLIAEISARGGWHLADVTVRAGSPESLSVIYDTREFKLGSGNYGEKLRRLAEIMNDVQQRGLDISYVDLRPERQAAAMVKQDKVGGKGAGVRKKRGR